MNPVTYQLLIEVAKPLALAVGRLGICHFPAGRYIYTGSARRNIETRIARHLRVEKRLHWHIDYLLAAPDVRVVGVRRYREEECLINKNTPGSTPVAGFGASDCRHQCGSHLRWIS